MTSFESITSVVQAFDNICQCFSPLSDGIAEEEFLRVLGLHEQFRQQCLESAQEAKRLRKELDSSLKNMADLETKLLHAHRLLETESKARCEADHERNNLEKRIIAIAELLQNERNLNDETKDKLAFVTTLPRKRKSLNPNLEEKLGNEIHSTGSFLSDLSTTQSEDDLLDINHSKSWRKHRPSVPKNTIPCVGNKPSRLTGGIACESPAAESGNASINGPFQTPIRTSRRSAGRRSGTDVGTGNLLAHPTKESNGMERISATTKVTIPQDGIGTIRAESTIQTVPLQHVNFKENQLVNENAKTIGFTSSSRTPYKEATAPSLDITSPVPQQQLPMNAMRPHNFVSKTFLRAEPCTYCQKKIRFGRVAFRCRDCPVRCHVDCRNFLQIACIPTSGTPTSKAPMGYIHEYAPDVPPKIPALIVHCVNEIETRGLNEVGLYRISGSEQEVKALTQLFLRGKTTPYLANIDIHVLCGCIKDFLRTLREPLIPIGLWKDFCNAIQNPNHEDIQHDLRKAIEMLPEANRDTLAFLVLHFMRIGSCLVIRMTLDKIARIFGPTIVGNSSSDPDQHAILTEVNIQVGVMMHLLKIPIDYWTKFVAFDDKENDKHVPERLKPTPSQNKESFLSYYATPLKNAVKKRKFYGTPPVPNKK